MSTPRPELLRARDLRAALECVGALVDAVGEHDDFAGAAVQRLARLLPSELATLSVCDLASGRRDVTGMPATAIGTDERAAFDRHFRTHPLVHYHAQERGRHAHRISDSVAPARFRETALYREYYRRIGIDHAMALPVHVDERWLVSFVFNRQGRDFSDRELALADCLRSTIAQIFRLADLLAAARRPRPPAPPSLPADAAVLSGSPPLTQREREVLDWVAAGKTDRDVAEILAISHRTVHKHLQRVYTKLGVETRTAAVMRAFVRH